MVLYDPPYCALCGGPFDHVLLLDFAQLGEDDQYLKECAYDSNLLSPPQSAVSWTSFPTGIYSKQQDQCLT